MIKYFKTYIFEAFFSQCNDSRERRRRWHLWQMKTKTKLHSAAARDSFA